MYLHKTQSPERKKKTMAFLAHSHWSLPSDMLALSSINPNTAVKFLIFQRAHLSQAHRELHLPLQCPLTYSCWSHWVTAFSSLDRCHQHIIVLPKSRLGMRTLNTISRIELVHFSCSKHLCLPSFIELLNYNSFPPPLSPQLLRYSAGFCEHLPEHDFSIW